MGKKVKTYQFPSCIAWKVKVWLQLTVPLSLRQGHAERHPTADWCGDGCDSCQAAWWPLCPTTCWWINWQRMKLICWTRDEGLSVAQRCEVDGLKSLYCGRKINRNNRRQIHEKLETHLDSADLLPAYYALHLVSIGSCNGYISSRLVYEQRHMTSSQQFISK